MTHAQMMRLEKAHDMTLDRVKRYGLYWNAVANVDIRQRTAAVHGAFHEITEALKEARLIMEFVHDMPIGGFNPQQLSGIQRKMVLVHHRLERAWLWMTTDAETGDLVMERDMDAEWRQLFTEPI